MELEYTQARDDTFFIVKSIRISDVDLNLERQGLRRWVRHAAAATADVVVRSFNFEEVLRRLSGDVEPSAPANSSATTDGAPGTALPDIELHNVRTTFRLANVGAVQGPPLTAVVPKMRIPMVGGVLARRRLTHRARRVRPPSRRCPKPRCKSWARWCWPCSLRRPIRSATWPASLEMQVGARAVRLARQPLTIGAPAVCSVVHQCADVSAGRGHGGRFAGRHTVGGQLGNQFYAQFIFHAV